MAPVTRYRSEGKRQGGVILVPISTLWQEAEARGIRVIWLEMEVSRGLYYQDSELARVGRSIIFLHPKLRESDVALRTVMCHEMGHDETAAGMTGFLAAEGCRMLTRRNEYLANRWAADFAIGEDRFNEFIRESRSLCDVAERFGVEVWLAQFAAEEYERRRKARTAYQGGF